MSAATKAATFAALLLLPLTAGAFTIDGDLSDWGVHPGPYGSSDWVPKSGISWTEEDQIGNYLGPGYGGQTFDAEAMYAKATSDSLYLAVVTGLPPWGASGWKPGDVAISFDPGSGTDLFGLRTTKNGLKKGGVYRTDPADWAGGLWGAASDPAYMQGHPTYLGKASFVYKAQKHFYANGSHYIIEARIPTSFFGSSWGGSLKLHWTQRCGNDAIDLGLSGSPSPPPVVPEPATFLLLGLGLAGLGFSSRLRRRRKLAS